MTTDRRLSIAGFLMTAVAYGPAWVGFGLFLPEFRTAFALSSQTAGFIASSAFAGFIVTLLLAGWLTRRTGPRLPVLLGSILATLGMTLVASAGSVPALTLGVAVSGASAGLSWIPFNNASVRLVRPADRPAVLSVVSTGTTVGIALAALLALAVSLAGFSWRLAWGSFAAAGVCSGLVALHVLREVAGGGAQTDTGVRLDRLLRRELVPLCGAAFSFGTTISIYLSFAADWVVRSGGLADLPDRTAAPLMFVAYGLCGVIGLASGRLERRLGLVPFLRGIFLASASALTLIALVPGTLPATLASAALQGGCVMTISAVFSFWSARLFPALPSTSFTATLLALAAGALLGPALAGIGMERLGGGATFLLAAGVSLLTALAVSHRRVAQLAGGRSVSDRPAKVRAAP